MVSQAARPRHSRVKRGVGARARVQTDYSSFAEPGHKSQARQLDAAIPRTALQRFVAVLGTRGTIAVRLQALAIHVIARHERLLDSRGTPLRKILIVRVATDIVRVTLDCKRPTGVLLGGC